MIVQFTDIDTLAPADFEIFVMELLVELGWRDAYVTKVGREYKHGDGGIDIFAYKNDLKFGIEVKQRSKGASVDIKALNQLVTGGRLSKTKNLILVTNSFFTSEVVARSMTLGIDLIDRDLLHSLFIDRRTEIGRATIKPRKYQLDVISQCLSLFRQGKKRILIEMATGLGKTYTSALLIREMIRNQLTRPKVLFLVHQVEIVIQSITAYKNVFGIGQYTFSTCFDGAYPEDSDFVFGTFDTLHIHLKLIPAEMFDIVVVDEAHHAPAQTYRRILGYLSPRYLVGMTATPFREDGLSVHELFGGPTGSICKYDLVWALKHNKLAFPKYIVLLNDLDERKLGELRKGIQIRDIDKLLFLNKKDEEVIRIIDRTIDENRIVNPKAIVFCRSIAHINHLIGFFALGAATFVHSRMHSSQRRENLMAFREGSAKYILVCDLFNEGIDIPETNILVFLRFTESRRIWLQQLGRGLRKTTNKECVYVLDFVGSLERVNDIKRLQKEVNDVKIDWDDVEPREAIEGVQQDDSLEVRFNMHAAQVLALIEDNDYRLSTRARAIDLLREYFQATLRVPAMSKLEEVFADISSDQVATLFGSWVAFIQVALPHYEIKDSPDYTRIEEFIGHFLGENGVVPMAETVVSVSKIQGLPFAVAADIETLFAREMNAANDQDVAPKQSERDDSVTVPETREGSLFSLHEDAVYLTKDLLALTAAERADIKKVFGSEFRFVRLLNEYRTREGQRS